MASLAAVLVQFLAALVTQLFYAVARLLLGLLAAAGLVGGGARYLAHRHDTPPPNPDDRKI